MKLWGIAAAIIIVIIIVLGAFYVMGESMVVDQSGNGPDIAYIHPSAVVKLDNTAITGSVVYVTLVSATAIVDTHAPATQSFLFDLLNSKAFSLEMRYTLNGVGVIEDQNQWTVGAGQAQTFNDYSSYAFGIKTAGTYIITVDLIDLTSQTIRGSTQISAVVS